MPSLVEKLVEIRKGVLSNRIELSSALLHSQHALAGLIPDGLVHWINRELLGYLDEERLGISSKLDEINVEDLDDKLASILPVYRTLPGLWLSWNPSDKNVPPTAVPGAILCLRGVIEFEETPVGEQVSTYVPVEYNEEKGFAFLCDARDIQEMRGRIRDRLVTFLDCVIDYAQESSRTKMLPPGI